MKTIEWSEDFQRQIRTALLPWMFSRLRVDQHLAKDLLQYGFYKLLKESQSKAMPDNPIAWMRTVIKNEFIDINKKKGLQKGLSLDDETDSSIALRESLESDLPIPLDLLNNDEVRECVERQLNELARERGSVMALALRLSAMDGLSISELTEILQRKSEGATRVFLHKCRQYAKSYLTVCWELIEN